MKKERHVVKKLLAFSMAAILPVASGMTVRAEESDDSSSDAGKEETVYVFTDASGNPEKTLVSNWLKNPDGSQTLTDTSDLSDITNVEGDETYTQSGNKLTWQADGDDIYYQGTTSKQAPVSVKLSYQLDGKDISADDLAGKSGHVTIRFDYENNATKNVTINGKNEEIKVPFAMVSGVVLPVDNFKNITVTNGRVLSEGKSNIVVGMAFPGLKESLNMDSASFKDNVGDYNIPEYVEIEADATDFSLGMTLTVASTDVISQLKDAKDGKIDTSSITDSINELTDASQQLVDGAQQLKDGTAKLRTGTNDLASGGGKLKDGAGELAGGLNTFDASLRSNLQSTKASFAKDSAKAEADKDAIVKMLNSMGILNADGRVNQQTMAQLKMLANMADKLMNSGLLQVAGIMDANGNLTADADQRTTQLITLLQTLNGSGALQAAGLLNADGTVKDNAAQIVSGYAAATQKLMQDAGLLDENGKLVKDAAARIQKMDAMITAMKDQKVLVNDQDGALTLNPTYAQLLQKKQLISLAQDPNLMNMLQMAEAVGLITAKKDDAGNDALAINKDGLAKLEKEAELASQLEAQGVLTSDGQLSESLQSMLNSGIIVNGDLEDSAKQLMNKAGIMKGGTYNSENAQAMLKMLDTLEKVGFIKNGELSNWAKWILKHHRGLSLNSFAVMEEVPEESATVESAPEEPTVQDNNEAAEGEETAAAEDSAATEDSAAPAQDAQNDNAASETKQDAQVTSDAAAADTTQASENTDASAEVEELKKQLADTQSQLEEANKKNTELQTQLDDANAKNADVQKQLDDANAKNADVQKQLADANAKNADLQTQLDSANSAKDDAYNQGYAAAQADAAAAAASQAPAAGSVETTDTAFIGSASDYVVSTASVSFSLDQVNQLTDLIKQFLADYGQAAGEAGAVKALESILNNADYQKMIAGGTTLSNGTNELYDGILKLRDGAGELDNGAQDLLDGMQKFDSEGIQKLADVFGNDLPSVIDRLDAIVDAGADYTSFTGSGNSNDSVKFVIKTSEVGSDSAN
ncbi:hypothetical protein [Galactobacillus timonensis]|uniref:hypothetical protein n=1 Tax=Galactobacillus timonensis TaxID=2041840 RepID=UPI001436B0CF|nr:hypothetical protein [Galactobacillus timonensis]